MPELLVELQFRYRYSGVSSVVGLATINLHPVPARAHYERRGREQHARSANAKAVRPRHILLQQVHECAGVSYENVPVDGSK
jgi:hypothetical protein